MGDFRKTRDPHLRREILRFLADDPDYTLNAEMLQAACAGRGYGCSRNEMEYQLEWLEERRLVTLQRDGAWIMAKATDEGVEVATGIKFVTGIQRPQPSSL